MIPVSLRCQSIPYSLVKFAKPSRIKCHNFQPKTIDNNNSQVWIYINGCSRAPSYAPLANTWTNWSSGEPVTSQPTTNRQPSTANHQPPTINRQPSMPVYMNTYTNIQCMHVGVAYRCVSHAPVSNINRKSLTCGFVMGSSAKIQLLWLTRAIVMDGLLAVRCV